jgi:malonyl-CoA O-methyltransferase
VTVATLLEPGAAYARWAPHYPPRAHNPVMQAEERAMLALLPSLAGQVVLDAGCGSGRYLLHALRRGAARAIGADPSAPMLARAADALDARADADRVALVRGGIDALPLADRCADTTICGLVVGHVPDLHACLSELHRVTRPGGRVLCSDVHPIGDALGWTRDFTADGQRYAVRHARHLYSHWHDACARLGLRIDAVREPMLDPRDIPADARFDRTALKVPVALVFALRRER